MTISQLEEAGIRKVATKVTTTLNCLEGAVQRLAPLVSFPPRLVCRWVRRARSTCCWMT